MNLKEAYDRARAAGTPDYDTDFTELEDALESWGALVLEVENDGTDDVLVLVTFQGGPTEHAVAYLERGCAAPGEPWSLTWCAYAVESVS